MKIDENSLPQILQDSLDSIEFNSEKLKYQARIVQPQISLLLFIQTLLTRMHSSRILPAER